MQAHRPFYVTATFTFLGKYVTMRKTLHRGEKMRVFLGVDIAHDKRNEEMQGEEFLVVTPTDVWTDKLDEQLVANLELFLKDPPFWQGVLIWISGMLSVMTTWSIIAAATAEEAMPLDAIWERTPWLFWLAAIATILCLILIVMRVRWYKGKAATEECSDRAIEKTYNAIYAELGVPADAVKVDVLQFSYRQSREGIHIIKGSTAETTNYEYKLFFDRSAVYLADRDGKYAFPRTSLRRITTVNERISMLSWNKERSHKRAPWSAYDLRQADNATMYVKPYHILELEKDGKVWGIWFPAYELPAFEKATGLAAEE